MFATAYPSEFKKVTPTSTMTDPHTSSSNAMKVSTMEFTPFLAVYYTPLSPSVVTVPSSEPGLTVVPSSDSGPIVSSMTDLFTKESSTISNPQVILAFA